jgi:pre-mRNA-splicing factor SYF2
MARKANQLAIVAEKKREDAPKEPRGVSKQKWFDEKKRKVGKQLEASGLDMSKAYMLDTQEDVEDKYKKWEKNLHRLDGMVSFLQFDLSAYTLILGIL